MYIHVHMYESVKDTMYAIDKQCIYHVCMYERTCMYKQIMAE